MVAKREAKQRKFTAKGRSVGSDAVPWQNK